MSSSDSDRAVAAGETGTIVAGAAAVPLLIAAGVLTVGLSLWLIAYPFVCLATAAVGVAAFWGPRALGVGGKLPAFGSAMVLWVLPIAACIAAFWVFTRLDHRWSEEYSRYRRARHAARLFMAAVGAFSLGLFVLDTLGSPQPMPASLAALPAFVGRVLLADWVLTFTCAGLVVFAHFYFTRWRWGAEAVDEALMNVKLRSIYRHTQIR